ncbi:hypothetical protein HDU98_001323 [Podochytrium sp. JEL0797]|nr:hypothetical protein HDU98_001323 [Podochytrium sp. JEL0797]
MLGRSEATRPASRHPPTAPAPTGMDIDADGPLPVSASHDLSDESEMELDKSAPPQGAFEHEEMAPTINHKAAQHAASVSLLPSPQLAGFKDVEMGEDDRFDFFLSSEHMPADRMDVDPSESVTPEANLEPAQQDVLDEMKGVFRMLSLVQEQSSIGSIEKIVIEQSQFKKLCNKLSPNSYKSLASVDYRALDNATLNLVGIYGNREMIARLMYEKGLFGPETLDKLLLSTNDKTKINENIYWFASGIYVALTETMRDPDSGKMTMSGFGFFWPEVSSWDDGANHSVIKNRVAFMRYLTKLTTGQFCLMTESDRYIFEVVQSQKQEEKVEIGDGFTVPHHKLSDSANPARSPQLLCGDTNQGFVVYSTTAELVHKYARSETMMSIRNSNQPVQLSLSLSSKEMDILINGIFKWRFQYEVDTYAKATKTVTNRIKTEVDDHLRDIRSRSPTVDAAVERRFIEAMRDIFVFVHEDGEIDDFESLTGIFIKDEQLPPPSEPSLLAAAAEPEISRDEMLDTPRHIDTDATPVEVLDDMQDVQDVPSPASPPTVVLSARQQELLDSRVNKVDLSTLVDKLRGLKPNSDMYSKVRSALGLGSAPPRYQLSQEETDTITLLLGSDLRDTIISEFRAWCFTTLRKIQSSYFEDVVVSLERDRKREELKDVTKCEICAQLEVLIKAINAKSGNSNGKLFISKVNNSYSVEVSEEFTVPAALQCQVFNLYLSEQDVLKMKADPKYIPTANFGSPRSTLTFPMTHKIRHIQYLGAMLLVVADDPETEKTHVYTIPSGSTRVEPRKSLHKERLGDHYHVSVNEKLGMLAFLTSNMRLVIFKFNDKLTTLSGYGQEHNLGLLYSEEVHVRSGGLCWVAGKDIVQESGDCRIFQLATQQFRPAGFKVSETATDFVSTPDGACLMYLDKDQSEMNKILVFKYWTSFKEIRLDFPPDFDPAHFSVTALGPMKKQFIMSLDFTSKSASSAALDILREELELSLFCTNFQQVTNGNSSGVISVNSKSSSMLKVWPSIWTQFPITPAFERTEWSGKQLQPFVTVVTESGLEPEKFEAYWKNMIETFKASTQKPTGTSLSKIELGTMLLRSFDPLAYTSEYPAGEWLICLVSLIPIQLAIARDSQFLPLKDGIQSADIVGADFTTMLDNLTLGWYESLFSYYSDMPVRVVSSMGEQSVGKSYSLNHLSDTSFASSAMRTTEGVWMTASCNSSCLIVCLDFEGVQSVERSVQEDTFLVLFNTAISNLILFRNNFVLARSIQELFTSFQASSSILDPEKNRPLLFNSYLAVIVRDVVPQDREGIVQEFRTKIATIIYKEKSNNFISKLFGQKLEIIPWPVIQDSEFYEEFHYLKDMLLEQDGYKNGITFLTILKTLMIKLRIADWSSIDSSLIQQRVTWLLSSLPLAFSHALSELDPIPEPLKSLDTNELIENPNDQGFFFSSSDSDCDIAEAIKLFEINHPRHENEPNWIAGLESFIDELFEQRVITVSSWISANLAAFKTKQSDLEPLTRKLEEIKIDARAKLTICKFECRDCMLVCVLEKKHDGSHDCGTNHQCPKACEFGQDHEDGSMCGLKANHEGPHFCEISKHSCGLSCDHHQHAGCAITCTKPAKHAEAEHHCSSSLHKCGKPCSLKDVNTSKSASRFSCPGVCALPFDQPHGDEEHICSETFTCPIECLLCKRPCSSRDHFHGKAVGTVHLCGQEHPCRMKCQDDGICKIEQQPQAVEAQFIGAHSSFTYTKQEQIAVKLSCCKVIPANEVTHEGSHVHYDDPKDNFHYCDARCPDCLYFCDRPRGHTQPLHHTSHGNMIETNWAFTDETGVVEVKGHKFGSGDGGAPLLCSMVCRDLGRHIHIDYCRHDPKNGGICENNRELEHIQDRMEPNPDRPKDLILHKLKWERNGFEDPYDIDLQEEFKLCDHFCPGPDHKGTAPSFCTRPLFHAPVAYLNSGENGHISADGHVFGCTNPFKSAFHIACHSFWTARDVGRQPGTNRSDAYSVILFDHAVINVIESDFVKTPGELLSALTSHLPRGGTDFNLAIDAAKNVAIRHQHADRSPVVIFLSDAGDSCPDSAIDKLCNALPQKVLLKTVMFGRDSTASLQRMATLADGYYQNSGGDAGACAFHQAITEVNLAETFLGIAQSLSNPRASLFRS